MTSMTLSEFLLARVAEDEAAARECYAAPPWHADGYYVMNHTVICENDDVETSAHMARWDPARVLAECEAKRQIVKRCSLTDEQVRLLESDREAWPAEADEILRSIASVHVDHPDYRDEWRP